MSRFSPLSWQILKKVIVVHGIVALILTLAQLWFDYKDNLNSISNNLNNSFEMFGPPISVAFYHANTEMMEEVFKGILSQSDFLGVAVYDKLSDEFITRGNIVIDIEQLRPYLKDEELFFSLEDTSDTIIYQHSMKITGEFEEKRDFGNLIVFSNKQLAFERIENTIFIVFFNSLIKVMVLASMFLLIFNRMLIQPLEKINNVVSNISPKNLKSLRLDLELPHSNELYLFQTRFNKLLDDLYKAQEKERKLQYKSKFIAMGEMIGNIAHQWRQPLTSVNMLISILLAKQKEDNQIEHQYLETKLEEIEKLNIYMANTIEDFLLFFNPNKSLEKINIYETINRSIDILQSKIEKENVNILLNIDKKISIKSNKQELMQVLIALLSNAIDSIVESEIQSNKKIEIYDKLTSEELIIYVKDYGKGIDEEIIDRIFEPYFTTKHQEQGVGLGLYMVKMIVETSLQGSIFAENHKDGAVFSIHVKR